MDYVFNDLVSRLVGCRLHSVQFVMDYVQLRFDSDDAQGDPVLSCYVMPVVETPGGPVSDGALGYADALRSLIHDRVAATSEAPQKGIRIEFALRALVLRPTIADLVGPEIAMLSDFADGSLVVWRPGGDAFEYLG